MRWFPPARSRFDREAKRVFPDMKRGARAKLGQDMGRHMGRTLFEIYHDAEFQTQHHKFRASGPGLAALKKAQAAGKGAICAFRGNPPPDSDLIRPPVPI